MNIRIVRAVAMVTAFAAAPLYAAELKSLSWEGDALRVEVKGKPGFTTAVLDDGKRLRVVLPNTSLASSAADIAGKGIVTGVFPYRAPDGNSTYIDFLMGGAGHLAGEEAPYGYRIIATAGGGMTPASPPIRPASARAAKKPVTTKARQTPPPTVTTVAAAAQGARPAADAATVAAGPNTLQSIDHVRLSGGRVQIKLRMARRPDEPGTFSTRRPARIAFDFFNTRSALGNKTLKLEGAGTLQSISAIQADDRTRVVLNLLEPANYESRIEPDGMTIIVQAAEEAATAKTRRTTRFAPARPGKHSVTKIDFRRGPEGSGRVIVGLSDDNVGINLREEPGEITIDFADASLPDALEKRLDVLDFATPVQTVDTFRRGTSVRVVVRALGRYEQSAFQAGNVFTISVKPIIEEEKEAGVDEFGYSGQKLSLNFQNIQVRAALQVIADFTDLNFVTSDAVGGELTLRLRNVPWDQALDIILRTKGLAKRQSGNVVWVAPANEIAARERQQLEANKATSDLEPLVSELIRINYAKASDIAALLKSIKAVGPEIASTPFTSVSISNVETETNALLSARGSVTVDERTNSVLIQDTPTKILEVKKLIAKLDKPVPQVMIETRIVEANEDFSKSLGARLGLANVNPQTNLPGQSEQNLGEGIVTGRLEGNVAIHNTVNDPDGGPGFPITGPSGLNVDLPAAGIGTETAGAIAYTLFKIGAGTAASLLSLELSALEAEERGKIIANPRLITTNQKEAHIEQGQQQVIPPTGLSQRATIIEAKLSLTVTPQITPENSVILDVTVTQDTFANLAAAAGVAAVNTKRITTQVLLGNGETVVIGGIYQEDNSETVTKIPLLGDIPVLGALFRTKASTSNRTELLIFLTPRILDPALNLTSN